MKLQLFRTAAPEESVLTVAELAQHLRLTPLESSPAEYQEEPLLQSKLDAATGWIDGAGGWLRRALIRQSWTLSLPCWPSDRVLRLPLPPLISVESVQYLDPQGTLQTYTPDAYRVVTQAEPGYILKKEGPNWPFLNNDPDAVRINFTAGYGSAEELAAAAPGIRQALMLLVATMFENREPIAFAAQPLKLPYAVEDLLLPYQFCGVVP